MLVLLVYVVAIATVFMMGCAFAAFPRGADEWAMLREDYSDRIARDASDIAMMHAELCRRGESLYMLSVWRRECRTTSLAVRGWLGLHARCRRQQARIATVAFIDRHRLALAR